MEHWSHQFCLACDKQVDSNAAYCSEACRLAELERSSTPSSQASSPGMAPSTYYPWGSPSTKANKFFLEPAYDFSNAKPYGPATTTARQHALFGDYSMSASTQSSVLTPSSSGTSLSSMQSASGTNEPSSISADAAKELRAYAMAFEYARSQRRRSS